METVSSPVAKEKCTTEMERVCDNKLETVYENTCYTRTERSCEYVYDTIYKDNCYTVYKR